MSTLTSTVHRIRRSLEANFLRDWPDRLLVERFTLSRDEAAFAELLRRHGPMVLATCRRVLRHEQDAEDAFQAAFLVLARKAGSIKEQNSIAGWLYRVAHRLALRAHMETERRKQVPLLDDVPLSCSAIDGPCENLELELERLPEQYRTALVLCYLEGRTQTEAARLLAITAHAVNSRLKRARDLLRQRLLRTGLATSAAALSMESLIGSAQAALPAALAKNTVQAALTFASSNAVCGVSALAIALAKGALHMITPKFKLVFVLSLTVVLLTIGALLVSSPALGEDPGDVVFRNQKAEPKSQAQDKPGPGPKGKPLYSVILLWMSGGPSQIDTWDPKPGNMNGGPFRAINTTIKGVQISEHMPHLAKQAKHLAIFRTLKHGEGDHIRASHLMRTGYPVDGQTNFPALGCVLGKELGDSRPDVPRYVSIGARVNPFGVFGPGYLGPEYAPLHVHPADSGKGFTLPPIEMFEDLNKKRAAKMRKSIEKAFDLADEKPAVKNAYGPSQFGQACLLARRLIERDVPVVEITMGGWDTHQDNFNLVQKRSIELDFAWSALMSDLQKSKRLETTLIVCMGEFGRTPRINANMGRDHWPACFSVVLGGGRIKGGQVIGKTSPDGTTITERPVSPAEFLATIYQAVGIDPAKEYRSNTDQKLPLVEKGAKAVKELLR
ncbi:MAG TPA: sigma-70 family RNA polymerase sigma factor [Gemmataceae bacterium]|nr:sigma-70 family RNA polymerase sigma factor [Gemmataceae bacterium]